jgi:hypothetical protein
VPGLQQAFPDVGTDEAGAAGNQEVHGSQKAGS